jgi:hypothetical protein
MDKKHLQPLLFDKISIDLCIKYDNLMDVEKTKDYINYGGIKDEVKKSLDNDVPLEPKLVVKYNMSVVVKRIINNFKQNKEKMNKYTKKQYNALRKGKTLHYYMKNPSDIEFIKAIEDIVKYV